jgi:hypothetical protein
MLPLAMNERYVAEAEFILARVHNRCCEHERVNNHEHCEVTSDKIKELAKRGVTHVDDAITVFYPRSEFPERAQACKKVLVVLNQWLE